jgi:hypothetical protein
VNAYPEIINEKSTDDFLGLIKWQKIYI